MAQGSTQQSQTSVNIPQLIAVALVGFLALRWYLSKPTGSSSSSSSSSRPRTIDIAKVNQVSAVFPQLDRRTIAWDLHRNGGNVAATTERVLGGRDLDLPPPTWQPAGLTVALPVSGTTGGKSSQKDDLITRYGLQNRVGGKGKEAVLSANEEKKRNAWAGDKLSRAEVLKRKREEMILAARRKMEEKDAE